MKKIISVLVILLILTGCQKEEVQLITPSAIGEMCKKYDMLETLDSDTMVNQLSFDYASNCLDVEGRFSLYFYIMKKEEGAMRKFDELYTNLKKEEGMPKYLDNSTERQLVTLNTDFMHYVLLRYNNAIAYGFGNMDGAEYIDRIIEEMGLYTPGEETEITVLLDSVYKAPNQTPKKQIENTETTPVSEDDVKKENE